MRFILIFLQAIYESNKEPTCEDSVAIVEQEAREAEARRTRFEDDEEDEEFDKSGPGASSAPAAPTSRFDFQTADILFNPDDDDYIQL